MKCDETRPACNRCTSTGRTCDGEIGTANLPVARSRQLAPRPDVAPKAIAVKRAQASAQPVATFASVLPNFLSVAPSPLGNVPVWGNLTHGLSDHERHGFSQFQMMTAPAMQIMLPSSNWVSVALQMSSQSAVIFHAITATGTMGGRT